MGSYRFGEGATGEGQIVEFTAPSEEFELARDSLQHFKRITIPETHKVNVEHGGYGRYSRYDIEQLDYAGGQNEAGGGYYEILQINDAPDGRIPFVSHGYYSSGSHMSQFFAEWESPNDAKAHSKKRGESRILTLDSFFEDSDKTDVDGLIRVVDCGYLSPWFYAVGNQSLVGDYVFPEHLAKDPVYQFGRPFLVPERSARNRVEGNVVHLLKTCMGSSEEERSVRRGYYQTDKVNYKVVQWHDGSITQLESSTPESERPIPLADQNTWVVEAQRKFNELLGGKHLGFEVRFADGGKFVGRYVAPPESPKPDAVGDYYLKVTYDDGTSAEGWVNDFAPTTDTPTVVAYTHGRLVKSGKKPIQIETVKRKVGKGSKKWSGVYHVNGSPEAE